MHICNPSTREAEAGDLQVPTQLWQLGNDRAPVSDINKTEKQSDCRCTTPGGVLGFPRAGGGSSRLGVGRPDRKLHGWGGLSGPRGGGHQAEGPGEPSLNHRGSLLSGRKHICGHMTDSAGNSGSPRRWFVPGARAGHVGGGTTRPLSPPSQPPCCPSQQGTGPSGTHAITPWSAGGLKV